MHSSIQASKARHNIFANTDHDRAYIQAKVNSLKTSKNGNSEDNEPPLPSSSSVVSYTSSKSNSASLPQIDFSVRKALAVHDLAAKFAHKSKALTIASTLSSPQPTKGKSKGLTKEKNFMQNGSQLFSITENDTEENDEKLDTASIRSVDSDRIANVKRALTVKSGVNDEDDTCVKPYDPSDFKNNESKDEQVGDGEVDDDDDDDEEFDDEDELDINLYSKTDPKQYKSVLDAHQHFMRASKVKSHFHTLRKLKKKQLPTSKTIEETQKARKQLENLNPSKSKTKASSKHKKEQKINTLDDLKEQSFLFLSSLSDTVKQNWNSLMNKDGNDGKDTKNHNNTLLTFKAPLESTNTPIVQHTMSTKTFSRFNSRNNMTATALLRSVNNNKGEEDHTGRSDSNSPYKYNSNATELNNFKDDNRSLMKNMDIIMSNLTFIPQERKLALPKPKKPDELTLENVFGQELLMHADIPAEDQIPEDEYNRLLYGEPIMKETPDDFDISQYRDDFSNVEWASSCTFNTYNEDDQTQHHAQLPKLDFSAIHSPSLPTTTPANNNIDDVSYVSVDSQSVSKLPAIKIGQVSQTPVKSLFQTPDDDYSKALDPKTHQFVKNLRQRMEINRNSSDTYDVNPNENHCILHTDSQNEDDLIPIADTSTISSFPIKNGYVEEDGMSINAFNSPNYRHQPLSSDTEEYVYQYSTNSYVPKGYINAASFGHHQRGGTGMHNDEDEFNQKDSYFSERQIEEIANTTTGKCEPVIYLPPEFNDNDHANSSSPIQNANKSFLRVKSFDLRAKASFSPGVPIKTTNFSSALKLMELEKDDPEKQLANIQSKLDLNDDEDDGVEEIRRSRTPGSIEEEVDEDDEEVQPFNESALDEFAANVVGNSTNISPYKSPKGTSTPAKKGKSWGKRAVTKLKAVQALSNSSSLDLRGDILDFMKKVNSPASKEYERYVDTTFKSPTSASSTNSLLQSSTAVPSTPQSGHLKKLQDTLNNRYTGDREGEYHTKIKVAQYLKDTVKEETQIMRKYLEEIDNW